MLSVIVPLKVRLDCAAAAIANRTASRTLVVGVLPGAPHQFEECAGDNAQYPAAWPSSLKFEPAR
jgi:hypothetical protein